MFIIFLNQIACRRQVLCSISFYLHLHGQAVLLSGVIIIYLGLSYSTRQASRDREKEHGNSKLQLNKIQGSMLINGDKEILVTLGRDVINVKFKCFNIYSDLRGFNTEYKTFKLVLM